MNRQVYFEIEQSILEKSISVLLQFTCSLDSDQGKSFQHMENCNLKLVVILSYYSVFQCTAVQFRAVQGILCCSAVQCSAVQCSAEQCSAVQCSAVQCSAVQCSTVQCSTVQCSAQSISRYDRKWQNSLLHTCSAVNYISLPCT